MVKLGLICVIFRVYFVLKHGKICKCCDCYDYYFFVIIVIILYSIIVIHVIYNIFNDPIDFYWYDIIVYLISMMFPFIVGFVANLMDKMEFFSTVIMRCISFFIMILLCIYHFGYKVGLYAHDAIEDDVIEYEL